jgi:hypothetical protein
MPLTVQPDVLTAAATRLHQVAESLTAVRAHLAARAAVETLIVGPAASESARSAACAASEAIDALSTGTARTAAAIGALARLYDDVDAHAVAAQP